MGFGGIGFELNSLPVRLLRVREPIGSIKKIREIQMQLWDVRCDMDCASEIILRLDPPAAPHCQQAHRIQERRLAGMDKNQGPTDLLGALALAGRPQLLDLLELTSEAFAGPGRIRPAHEGLLMTHACGTAVAAVLFLRINSDNFESRSRVARPMARVGVETSSRE